MSKRLILVLALTLVVGISVAAYAEVQNVKVSGDLSVQGVSRSNLILRKHNRNARLAATQNQFTQFERNISGILSHVRVRVDADLTDNVSTTVRLINERVWDKETDTANDSDIDLDLAYVALKEFLYSPLSLTIGRQELGFGNGLIIGDVDTNAIDAGHGIGVGIAGLILPKSLDDLSVRKAFDALRATLNYDPLVIDALYAKIDENSIDIADDINLYGVNANYSLDKNTTIEGYYWEKQRKKATTSEALPSGWHAKDDVVRTLGTRVQYNGIKNLAVGLEGAYQFGAYIRESSIYPDDALDDASRRTREAYAAQLTSQYNLSDLIKQYEPVIGMNYSFLSGDPYRSTDNHYRGWDPMFENQNSGTLFNKILAQTNMQIINARGSLTPFEDVKLSLDYYHLRFIKPYQIRDIEPITVNLSGIVGDPTYHMKPGKKIIGNEVDATLTYDYTEDVQFGLTAGWFNPGKAFDAENDNTASQLIGSMKVTF